VSTELLDEMREELLKTRHALSPSATASSVDADPLSEAEAILNDIKQNLVKINHHGKRADAIVKGMLQHSRTNAGKKELTDINALADEYLRLSYHGLRAKDKSFNADFKTDFDPNLPKVEVISQDMGRVLLNLINNAFHAVYSVKTGHALSQPALSQPALSQPALSPQHALPPQEYKPTVTITTRNLGNKIEISVKDNGPGIPEEIKNKIFQPFFTTKPTGQGTGLGLSLSYDIVKAHGGEIKAESAEGKGTEFIIVLPKQPIK